MEQVARKKAFSPSVKHLRPISSFPRCTMVNKKTTLRRT